MPADPPRRLSLPEILLGLVAVGFALLAAETLGPYATTLIAGAPAVTLFEDSWKTIHFDPLRGYLLTREPSRFARFCAGRLEFAGILKGNNQGFPDRDDFDFERGPGNGLRIAVFGDSFTAGQFLEVNWPDRVEDLSVAARQPLVLLNLAVDGGGLGNWWSILHRWAVPGGLEADLAVFAVFNGDLERHFAVSEHRGFGRHMFGRVQSWDPEQFPKTLSEAKPVLQPLAGFIVERDVYEGALHGRFPPQVATLNAPPPPFGRFLASRVRKLLARPSTPAPAPEGACGRTTWDPQQLELVEEMDRDLDRLGQSRMVVFLGDREDVIAGSRCQPVHEREFADRLHAEFIDGREMFEGKSPEDRRALFFPVDGHWNQRGSDTFAHFMLARLRGRTGSASPSPASATDGVPLALPDLSPPSRHPRDRAIPSRPRS